MKRALFGVCGLLCAASMVSADQLGYNPLPLPADATVGVSQGPGISAENCQANDNENVTAANTVACAPNPQDGSTTDNGFARRWVVQNATVVKQVRYGVEICQDITGQGRPCDVEIRLYSAPAFPTFGSAVLLHTTNDSIPDGTSLEVRTVNIPDVAVAAGTNLVVEVYNGPAFRTQLGYWAASNTAGQSAPSYLRTVACALTNWTDFAAINFPNVHLILCWNDEGGGGEGGCQYKISKSKAKKGCGACPSRNDIYASGDACEDVKDCPKKLKIGKLDCPDGGPGFCKGVKGKVDSCQQ